MPRWVCVDGNEAAARVAHHVSEVIAIYPITPASPMGELADAWSVAGRENAWGLVPEVVEMQSEAGAAGALHGALQEGALATTFTASQGLLLMLPNMYKIAGQLLPCVIHVAARAVATHALSIFGDHSDVMAARGTGFAMLCSRSVQEAQDLALVAHAASLRSRVPFLHFFDGFRTSHEVNKIQLVEDEEIAALIDDDDVLAHRGRRLTPDRPVLRGSAQNPDVFFQAREASNPFHAAVPEIVQERMDALAERTGRRYALVEYQGDPRAERVIVAMGSGLGALHEAVDAACAQGERVGVLAIRLYRPFPSQALLDALPESVSSLAVLDRCKEPGATGEPLYQDVVATLARSARNLRVVGGRYGLGSKEFTPAMAKAVFDELGEDEPRHGFTLGIVDDVSHTSLPAASDFDTDTDGVRAIFFGMGSDGSVGAAKNSIKIIGEETDLQAQGYFVYDSKKSGAVTVSHLRFGPEPIRSTYLIHQAEFVACHRFALLERMDVVGRVRHGGTLLLNSPHPPEQIWSELPREVQEGVLEKELALWVIDADRVAREAGMGNRINTVMQPCFFALSRVLPEAEATLAIKHSIEKTYGKRGEVVVRRNLRAVDRALEALHRVEVPAVADSLESIRAPIPRGAGDFVERVTARLLAGEGDLLPVSALPPDGTFPTGTARFEKRGIASKIPIWDPEICIDCGKCAIACPHAAIRLAVCEPDALASAPEGFRSKDYRSRELPGMKLSVQVAPDDCTGCGVCVEVCPARSKEEVKHKSLNMMPAAEHREQERRSFEFFQGIEGLSDADEARVASGTVKGSQLRRPLFEFSGACGGCGETPYLKLLTQLFGDRMLVANATGCSSIYGGNLPTTPWSVDAQGRGPAWANSLFEDNAEFGLGILLGLESHIETARRDLEELAPKIGDELARSILEADQGDAVEIELQRGRVARLVEQLAESREPIERRLASLAPELVRKSVWIIGGDGWAYDIGSGGLDHVLASGRNVNVLVLDTQVYSNTGGQASKATPRGAIAKFASAGKPVPRKDLGMIANEYGNVYIAQVALGGDDAQTVKALLEADAWEGPSLIIAYSSCIAHGIDMQQSMRQQALAVKSGFWPLYRFHPGLDPHTHPFHLDSRKPSIPLRDFALSEARFAMLERSDPERSQHLLALAQKDVEERWRYYEQLAELERTIPHEESAQGDAPEEGA